MKPWPLPPHNTQSQSRAPDLARIRRYFPGVERQIHLDVAARGLVPVQARKSIEADINDRVMGGGVKSEMFDRIDRVRREFAVLHHIGSNDVAITKNISEGLNAIAAAYPWRAGDAVVVCEDREHPNNIYLWRNLARRIGIEVRVVSANGDGIPTDTILAAIDARVRMVSVSSVTFFPGLKTDLVTIGEACRSNGAMLLVDAAQSAGVMALDLSAAPIDALACSAQKGLMGLYGIGLLYVAPEWAERLVPAYLARFGVDLGNRHEADVGGDDYELMAGARRFDLGNYNFTAAAGLQESLALINAIGPLTIESHAIHLSRQLGSGLAELGFDVAGDPTGPDYSHIVSLRADENKIGSLGDTLQAENIKFSLRRGAIRFSCHVYNTREEIDAVLAVSRAWASTRLQ